MENNWGGKGGIVSAVSKTQKGLILVGSDGGFGYLNFMFDGKIKYVSLSSKLPKKEAEFGRVWAIQVINDNYFFCANDKILWYKDTNFVESFKPVGVKFHTFLTVGNTLLVRETRGWFCLF